MAALGAAVSACASTALVRVQPAGPDAIACVQTEVHRLGYSYSPQKPASTELRAWRPGGDVLRARVQLDSVGRPMLRLEAARYNDAGMVSMGDRSVDFGGGSMAPSRQAVDDLAALAGRCGTRGQ